MAKLRRTTTKGLIKLSLDSVLVSSKGQNWVSFACGIPNLPTDLWRENNLRAGFRKVS
jgi:hypothetical protein